MTLSQDERLSQIVRSRARQILAQMMRQEGMQFPVSASRDSVMSDSVTKEFSTREQSAKEQSAKEHPTRNVASVDSYPSAPSAKGNEAKRANGSRTELVAEFYRMSPAFENELPPDIQKESSKLDEVRK